MPKHKKKKLRKQSNIELLKARLQSEKGVKLIRFSDLHFRLIGKNIVDYIEHLTKLRAEVSIDN